MIKKTYMKTGNNCRVTFKVANQPDAKTIAVVGDFNDWDDSRNALEKRKDGSFTTTVTLKTGETYRFKYLMNQAIWMNDADADDNVPNTFGTRDSIIKL